MTAVSPYLRRPLRSDPGVVRLAAGPLMLASGVGAASFSWWSPISDGAIRTFDRPSEAFSNFVEDHTVAYGSTVLGQNINTRYEPFSALLD